MEEGEIPLIKLSVFSALDSPKITIIAAPTMGGLYFIGFSVSSRLLKF